MSFPIARQSALLPWLLFVSTSVLAAQGEGLDARIKTALDQARKPLLAHLSNQTDASPGMRALLCLAALHDGVAPENLPLSLGLARLASANCEQTYDLSLRLMVMEFWPDYPDRKVAAASDCKKLLMHRHESAFGYEKVPQQWDLSNTQYGALGLRAAASMGVAIERRVWTGLAAEVGSAQHNDGGFGYLASTEGDAYPSMTAAGIAVLAVCRQALEKKNQSNSELDGRIKNGWSFLTKQRKAIGDPATRWSYYFHYGLERAAILCDVEQLADLDWYQVGAAMLVQEQQPGGGWSDGPTAIGINKAHQYSGDPASTAFAILFLRRGFRKVPGAVTGSRVLLLANLIASSSDTDVQQCGEALAKRGKTAMPAILVALREELPQRRRAALLALRTISGEDFGIDAGLPPEQNADALRKAEFWYLKNR